MVAVCGPSASVVCVGVGVRPFGVVWAVVAFAVVGKVVVVLYQLVDAGLQAAVCFLQHLRPLPLVRWRAPGRPCVVVGVLGRGCPRVVVQGSPHCHVLG